MRTLTILGIVSLLAAAITHAASPETPAPRQFKFTGVIFDHQQNRVICEGRIAPQQFQKWFRQNYTVEGERVETPQDATAFGALVLTDGDEILVMPLYTWGVERLRYFACQSHEIGKAPMFSVVEQSQKAFLDRMKLELGKLQEAEPVAPANGASPRPGGGVSLIITSATAQRNPDMLDILCDAALDNHTDTPLVVTSNFYSAFDGLSLVVRDVNDRLLAQQSFLVHQSPNASDRHFTLRVGRNTHHMFFPLITLTNAPSTLRVQLVGTLPGSGYHAGLTSQVVRVTVREDLR